MEHAMEGIAPSASPFAAPFAEEYESNEGKDLVVQYSVKNEQGIDCGGGYLKVRDRCRVHSFPPVYIIETYTRAGYAV